MHAPGAIDEDIAALAGRDSEVKCVQSDSEGSCIVRRLPGGKCLSADFVEWDGRPLGLSALARCRVRYRSLVVEQPRRFHRGSDVFAAFSPEGGGRAPVVLASDERETALEFGYPTDLFPPRVIVRERDNGAVLTDERPHDVSVPAATFGVIDAATLRVFETEFSFVMLDECCNDCVRIGAIGRRIDVHMMYWTVSATVSR